MNNLLATKIHFRFKSTLTVIDKEDTVVLLVTLMGECLIQANQVKLSTTMLIQNKFSFRRLKAKYKKDNFHNRHIFSFIQITKKHRISEKDNYNYD